MIHSLVGKLAEFVIGVISASGYPGIILLMAIESACIPLPSEIIMPFSGYLVSLNKLNLWAVTVSGAVGNLLGSIAVYWVGRSGLDKVVRRLSPHHAAKAEGFYARYGIMSVFIGRMLPIVRTFISLPAGIMRVPFIPFCIWTFLGSVPWCFALTYLGMVLGKNWNVLEPIFHRIDIPIILILAGGILVWYWRNRD